LTGTTLQFTADGKVTASEGEDGYWRYKENCEILFKKDHINPAQVDFAFNGVILSGPSFTLTPTDELTNGLCNI
jgi:hypothetical protein